ncbi:MAG: hypothetical protein PHQ43_12430 [Dehalococcoidales bacterium]|nr:hypothetical protein [Dehalococcoidales bacterium]
MAYEIMIGTLTDVQKSTAADLVQKLEALDAALAAIQTERAEAEGIWNQKTNAINIEKSKVRDELRALRAVDIKEV